MSAGLPPITDIARRGWHGRKVPTADVVAFVNSIVVFFKIQVFGHPAAAGPLWNSYILKASFILFLYVSYCFYMCFARLTIGVDPLAEWHFSKLSGY